MCSLYRSDGVSNSWLRFPSVSTRRDEVPGGCGVALRERERRFDYGGGGLPRTLHVRSLVLARAHLCTVAASEAEYMYVPTLRVNISRNYAPTN